MRSAFTCLIALGCAAPGAPVAPGAPPWSPRISDPMELAPRREPDALVAAQAEEVGARLRAVIVTGYHVHEVEAPPAVEILRRDAGGAASSGPGSRAS